MKILENCLYREELDRVTETNISWYQLKNARFFISGACGMIGSYLIDVLIAASRKNSLNINIHPIPILTRSKNFQVKSGPNMEK